MTKHLILQILGNSDITVTGRKGYETLERTSCLNDIQTKSSWNEEDFKKHKNWADFPIIEQLKNSHQQQFPDAEALWGIILTDQTEWMQARSATGPSWGKVIALDGIWWDNILSQWCQQKSINYYPIHLKLEAEKPGEPRHNGAADWEKMAEVIRPLLSQHLTFNQENKEIEFHPSENAEPIKIDKIIIQHSSGTPALSSALYLWGIERKLVEGEKIEFVYISEQESETSTHQGSYWQWRMKDSQIRELLKIQDFSGARVLLDQEHKNYQQLSDQLEFLDESVSLNLTTRGLQGREAVIERISIAVWSEKAFRDRSQWLHWYLRMGGAFELALLLVVERQGNDRYHWDDKDGNSILQYTKDDSSIVELNFSISSVVNPLLSKGNFATKNKDGTLNTNFEVTAVKKEEQWSQFKQFYLHNCRNEGFTDLRNKLYHSLEAEAIARLLSQQADSSGKTLADKAVEFLHYILKLAGKFQEVQDRVNSYNKEVKNLEDLLE